MHQRANVVIVDYGMGNILSVANAIKQLGYQPHISSAQDDIAAADAIILPGVGAFGEAVAKLNDSGLAELLFENVITKRKPFMGICLGLQLLAKSSTEGGLHMGFGWFDAKVERLADGNGDRVPHVGWNDVHFVHDDGWFQNIETGSHYYFDHSFHMKCDDITAIAATSRHGAREIVAALRRDNIFACQFHPERSQNNGLRLYRNFLNYVETTLNQC